MGGPGLGAPQETLPPPDYEPLTQPTSGSLGLTAAHAAPGVGRPGDRPAVLRMRAWTLSGQAGRSRRAPARFAELDCEHPGFHSFSENGFQTFLSSIGSLDGFQ